MYDFWYVYVKPKYGRKLKLCYIDIESLFAYIKTDDNCENIAEAVKTRFHTSNYELDRPLPKEKSNWINKRWIRWKIIKGFLQSRAKAFSYPIDDGSEDKKANNTKSGS